MKKLITLLSVTALLAAVAGAQAFKAGDYQGKTQRGKRVSFSVPVIVYSSLPGAFA